MLAVGALLGFAMGCVIHYFEIQPFIVTLAGMFLARGACYAISVDSVSINDPAFMSIAQGTVYLPGDTFITTGRDRLAGRRSRSASTSCTTRGSGARSTPSAAASSPRG